jgi:hypothetical protein
MAGAYLRRCSSQCILHAVQARLFWAGRWDLSVPWCPETLYQDSFAFLNFSEIRSFRWAMDMTLEYPTFSAARPARASAFSLPGVQDKLGAC